MTVNATAQTTQFVRFLAAGALAAAANILSRMGLSQWIDLPVAVIAAYLVGMAVAFLLMRSYVFPPGQADLHRQIAIFALVNLAALIQTLVVTLLFADIVLPWAGVRSHVELIAHMVGVGVPIVTSFIGHRRWSFR